MEAGVPLLQNGLHERLTRFVNGEPASRRAQILGAAAPGPVMGAEARDLVAAGARLRTAQEQAGAPGPGPAESVAVPRYEGSDPHVLAMREALRPLAGELLGAYLHGSLASGDAIPYSDFDALVILRDDTLASPERLSRTARRLAELRRIMLEFDPLQHHGWFVLSEADLRSYCDAYFPFPLFAYARSLQEAAVTVIQAARRDSTGEYQQAWRGLARAVRRDLAPGRRPRNAYTLKNVLSRAMLLPALYLQARDGTAVYKKFSFDLARADFPAGTFAVMDEISGLRDRWHYRLSGFQRRLLVRPGLLRRRLGPALAPPVPADLGTALTPAFWQALGTLVDVLDRRLGLDR